MPLISAVGRATGYAQYLLWETGVNWIALAIHRRSTMETYIEYTLRHPFPFYFRDQVLSSVSYFSGRHDIRFGYQFMTAIQKSSTWSTSGMRAVYRNGRPDSVNTYNVPITSTLTRIPVAYEPSYRDNGLYVQDKWTPMRKLTVNAGLRFETTYGWQPAACQVDTIFVAAQCFPEIKGAPDFKALAEKALSHL